MQNCIFCRVARGEIPTKFVGENTHAVAFRDLNPQAPVHVLVIPREHLGGIHDVRAEQAPIVSDVLLLARDVADELGLGEKGYRLVTNQGEDGGQSVFHWHVHLLGGRAMTWPPG